MDYKYFPLNGDNIEYFLPLLDKRNRSRNLSDENLLKIGAVNEQGIPCGIILILLGNLGYAEIKYLYTSEPERSKWLMKGMIYFAAPFLYEAGIKRLYLILVLDKNGRADESLLMFCKNLGGKPHLITHHLVTVKADQVIKKTGKTSTICRPLRSISQEQLRYMILEAEDEALRRIHYFLDEAGGDFYKAFDKASTFIFGESGLNEFMLFVPREENSGITLVYMQGKESKSLAMILGYAALCAIEEYGPDALISFATVNGIGDGMGKLFPEEREWMQAERIDIELEKFLDKDGNQ